MPKPLDPEPWRGLSPRVADLIEPELGAIAAEILATIARDVPEYARPLEGSFGRGVRTGVEEALRQFLDLVRDPDAGREPGREVYVALGRGELRQGRTLDSLQAAYRVGARVAWRQIAAAGQRAELDAEQLSLLAEAIFAYIDELSADSVDGYAEAQREAEDVRRRRHHELAALLARVPAADPADVRAAAEAAGWKLPRSLAALACADGDLPRVLRRLPTGTLGTMLDGAGCILFPDAEGPGQAEFLVRAGEGTTLALGPTGDPAAFAESWSLARSLLRAAEAGRLPAAGLLRADDHLGELLLFEGNALSARIASRRLAPFDGLTPKAQARMRETALAHVRHGGNAMAMATELHIHPQTARYRMARLRELLGDQLDDPDARFELEVALRAAGHSP
jgi:hypothetical protein